MKLLGKRNLPATAEVADDRSCVLIGVGPYRFTASRGEAVHLARQLVEAIEALGGDVSGRPQ